MAGSQTIIGHHTGASSYDGWVIQLVGVNISLFTNQGGNSPSGGNSKTFSMTLEAGYEYALIIVIQDSPNIITAYVNDLKISSQTPLELPSNPSVDLLLGIQIDGSTLYNPFTGSIWDVEIFQALLTDSQRKNKTSGIFVS